MLADRSDLVAKLLDREPKARHGYGIEQGVMLPQLVVAERPPFAVRPLFDIGHDSMNMSIGLLVAVGIVLEQRNQKIAGLDHLLLALHFDPGLSEVLFRPGERLLNRLGVCLVDPLVAADERQQRPALGHREGEIGAGAVLAGFAADAGPVRQKSLEHSFKLFGIDFAAQPLTFSPLAEPGP